MHRVVIVGAGFGGLFAAKALRRAPVEVTVVDRMNHHLFQPLLYQVATGILSEGEIAPPIRDVLRHQNNTRVVLGEVVAVDLAKRELTVDALENLLVLGYDSLIVAAGASQSYFGNDQFAEFAPGMKSIDDALELRGRIFEAFEAAELEPDPAKRAPLLTFVIVGAGPTGVELAGQIRELSHRALQHNFRTFDPRDTRIVLLEGGPAVLAAYPPSLQRHALRDLEKLGIEVHPGALVTGVDELGVDVEGADRIEARTKIWAAGVAASPLGRLIAGADVDRAGRVRVLPDLTLPGRPEVFIVGDLIDLNGLPGVAEVAIQGGRHAAKTIVRRLRGNDRARPFHYHDLGTIATISRFRAVATVGPLRLTGLIAWLAWLFIHLVFLTGFKNRVSTVAAWAIAFLGRDRRQRTITWQQVHARLALERHAQTR